MSRKKPIWTEDECTRHTEGHEYVGDAWQRLFNEKYDSAKGKLVDHGDCMEWQMPNGYSVWSIYGAWDEICETDENE